MTDVEEIEAAPELVTRAVAGEEGAFAGIYAKYHGLVYRFVWRRTGNPTTAEDLAADVFLRALRNIDKFEWQGTDIAAWLLAITRNIIADHYRSGKIRKEIPAGSTDIDHGRASTEFEAMPEDIVIDHIMSSGVIALLPQLSADQGEVLTLRFLEGLSLTETAEKMGKNESSVKALQYRAVRSLARLWHAEQEKRDARR